MLKSGFFNSIDGDRKYNADDFADYFEGILTDGIYASVGTCFQCFVSDKKILVGTGRAKLLNRYIRNTTDYEVQLDAADAQHDRIDTICLKVDKANSGERVGSIVTIKGTPAASPKYPEIPENTEDVAYLRIASFRVAKNGASITQYARHVGETGTPYVQIDKSINVEAQYRAFEEAYAKMISDMEQYESSAQKEFAEWFASVSEQVSGWMVEEVSDQSPYGFEMEHLTECRFENPDQSESTTVTLTIPTAPPSNYHSKAVLKGFQHVTINFESILKPPTNLSGSSNIEIITTDTNTVKFLRHNFENADTIKVFDLYYDGFGYRYTWNEIQEKT